MIIHRKANRLEVSHIDAGDVVFVDGSRLLAGGASIPANPIFYTCPHSGEIGIIDADNPLVSIEEEQSALETLQGGIQ